MITQTNAPFKISHPDVDSVSQFSLTYTAWADEQMGLIIEHEDARDAFAMHLFNEHPDMAEFMGMHTTMWDKYGLTIEHDDEGAFLRVWTDKDFVSEFKFRMEFV
jgi:hypothetical protein